MAGNAFEFCSDWATDYPADGGHQTNPTGPEESPWFPNKIMRGAGVWSGPNNLMPFFRNFNDPSQSYPTIGLRVLIP
jgi:formylglycine-generating enzyme required for sulfatase activity